MIYKKYVICVQGPKTKEDLEDEAKEREEEYIASLEPPPNAKNNNIREKSKSESFTLDFYICSITKVSRDLIPHLVAFYSNARDCVKPYC